MSTQPVLDRQSDFLIRKSADNKSRTMSKKLGTHLLLELYDCDLTLLDDAGKIEEQLVASAKEAGATVVTSTFHQFSPQGVSGVVVIAESHITIHTWPEYGYAAVDVFTCGNPSLPGKISQSIVSAFKAGSFQEKNIDRGISLPLDSPNPDTFC